MTLSLQSCLGLGSPFKTIKTSQGSQIGVNDGNQAALHGKIYFTLDRNLYVLDGDKELRQLTKGVDVRDPAVSPDGSKIAFIIRYQNYSDLAVMPTAGGPWRVLISGAGQYVPNPPLTTPKSTALWFAQPAWSSDSQHLLVLSDYQKEYWNFGLDPAIIQYDSPILDLEVFSLSLNDPTDLQVVAYPVIGDGGLRDPSYRPGHSDQILYTGYKYDASTSTQQHIGLYMEDPGTIADNPGVYHPGLPGNEYDPSVEITADQDGLMNLEPVFSPDGNTILYVRRNDSTHMSLYTMPVPNGITTNASAQAAEQTAMRAYNQSSLLKTSEYISQPIWSPDGKQILYMNFQDSSFDLWLANVTKKSDGTYSIQGDPMQLTATSGHLDADSRPCWSK